MEKTRDIKRGVIDKVTSSRREKSGVSLKKKRDAIQKRQRTVTKAQVDKETLVQLMGRFNLDQFMSGDAFLPQLRLLNEILCHYDIVYHLFAPSNMSAEHKDGPFLFENDVILQRLMQLFAAGSEDASLSIAHISGHPESYTWALKLTELGVMEILGRHLTTPSTSKVLKENCLWICSQLANDNMHTRDLLLKVGLANWLLAQPRDDVLVVTEVSWTLKMLFACAPAPVFEHISGLWDWMVECFHTLPRHESQIMENIVDTLNLMALDTHYRSWLLVSQRQLLLRVREMDIYTMQIVGLFATLAMDDEQHEFLVTQVQAARLFEANLDHLDPIVRIQAALGICNLGANPKCLPEVCTERILATTFRLFSNCDIADILKLLDEFVLNVVESAAHSKLLQPIQMLCQYGLIRRMSQMFYKGHDFQLLVKCIWATDVIMTLVPSSREQFEEVGVLDSIESLLGNPNERVQKLATDFADKWKL